MLIGQSDLLLRALYFICETMQGGDTALRIVLSIADVVSLLLQLAVFKLVFEPTAKKEAYTMATFYWILFNPVSILGGNTHGNLGAFNDCLWYTIIYYSILGARKHTRCPHLLILNIIAVYFDPRLIFLLIPICVIQYECGKSPEAVGE